METCLPDAHSIFINSFFSKQPARLGKQSLLSKRLSRNINNNLRSLLARLENQHLLTKHLLNNQQKLFSEPGDEARKYKIVH